MCSQKSDNFLRYRNNILLYAPLAVFLCALIPGGIVMTWLPEADAEPIIEYYGILSGMGFGYYPWLAISSLAFLVLFFLGLRHVRHPGLLTRIIIPILSLSSTAFSLTPAFYITPTIVIVLSWGLSIVHTAASLSLFFKK